MKYTLLGKSGLRVSELCLGTMTFGEDWGWGSNFDESRKVLDVYKAAGGNFLDTANLYTNGTSEKYIGEFIKGEREKWVVATKYSLGGKDANINTCGNHRKNMMQSVEGSLRRLKVDYIDLLWLHIWDYTTPIEEVMRGFDDLVRSQKVLYVGISDAPAWVVSSANTMASLRGWTPFVGLQIEYSLKERTPERDLIPMAKAFDLAVTPWSPLAGGLLTGKYNQKEISNTARLVVEGRTLDPRDLRIAEAVVAVANRIGKTPAQVALKWIMQQGHCMVPIVGARTAAQMHENLGSCDFVLSVEEMRKLDEASAISLGFPRDFFNGDTVQKFCFGDTLRTLSMWG
jgi:aryl-alcohol dehydrogenase-like predicted oxidoreductase